MVFTKKKLFGLLFAICILVGLLTATALAEEVTYSEQVYVNISGTTYKATDGYERYLQIAENGTNNGRVDQAEANLIFRYNRTEGKLTIQLKDINVNDAEKAIITLGHDSYDNNLNVDIIVSGPCSLAIASGKNVSPITSKITGTITVLGDGNANTDDHLTLTARYANVSRTPFSLAGDLVIDGVKFTARQTNASGASAIIANNVTIQNSAEVTLYSYNKNAIQAAGNVQVNNSTLTMSNNRGNPLISLSDDTKTITFNNSTVIGANGNTDGSMFNKAPETFTGCSFEGSTAVVSVDETTGSFTEPEAELTEYNASLTTDVSGKYHYFKITPCNHVNKVVIDSDCTKGLQCADCGAAIPDSASSGHTGPEQTNCEEAVLCTNPGCTQTVHPAGTHTPGAEDTDCTTAVNCTKCGEPVFAAQTHSSAAICGNELYGGGTCTHERKQAYVYLLAQEITLTDGQTKYYQAKNVEGDRRLVASNVTPEDATIIISYNEGEGEEKGKVTVELKGVHLEGRTVQNGTRYDTFIFGNDTCNDFDVEILVNGACTLDASVCNNANIPIGSNITGEFTIKGKNGTGDSLTIIDKSATGNSPSVNIAKNLVIENVALTVRNMKGTNVSSSSSAIGAKNITIENSNVNLYSYEEHAINATGDVNVEGSTLTMSSDNSEDPLVNTTGTFTITESTVTAGAGHKNGSIFNKAPVISPYGDGFKFRGSESNPTVTAATATTDAVIDASAIPLENTYTAGTNYKYFNIAPCNHVNKVVIDSDCTKGLQCADCGAAIPDSASSGHTGPEQTNCEEAVLCTNPGCEVVLHEATEHTGGTATCTTQKQCTECHMFYGELAAHTPEDDDGNCTTDILCKICHNVAIPGAPTHTYGGSSDPDCNADGCAHKRNLAYVQLLDEKLTLADGDKYYYSVANDVLTAITTEGEMGNAQIIISYKEDQNNAWGKVTVTLNSANINTYSNHIFTLGKEDYGNFDVDIIVSGSCSIGNSTNTKTPIRTTTVFTGTITIKGDGNDSTVDQLTLTRNLTNGNAHVLNLAGNLVIDGVKVTAKQPATSGGSAIVAKDVIINSSNVTLFSDSKYAIDASGNVLVEDSTLTMSSAGAASPLVNVADGKTITIDNSTVTAGFTTNGGSIFSVKPVLNYDGYAFSGSTTNPAISEDAATLGDITLPDNIELTNEYSEDLTTNVSGKYRYFHIAPCTHAPEAEWEDIDQDCTTGLQCPTCGAVLGEAEFTEHITNSSLTDCTLGLHCERDGCTGYAIEPKEDHTWDDELNECNVCHMPRALTPSYIITIPAEISTSNDAGVTVTFRAQAIENLAAGDSILVSVTAGLDNSGKIELKLEDNDSITIQSQMSIGGVTVNNATPEIVSFAANGDHSEEVPIAFAIPEDTQYAGTYTGTLTFGVSWVQGGNAA